MSINFIVLNITTNITTCTIKWSFEKLQSAIVLRHNWHFNQICRNVALLRTSSSNARTPGRIVLVAVVRRMQRQGRRNAMPSFWPLRAAL